MEYTDEDLLASHGKSLDQSLLRKTLRGNQSTGIAVSTSLVGLVYSADRVNWEKPSNFKLLNKKLALANGDYIRPSVMKRPFVYYESNFPKNFVFSSEKRRPIIHWIFTHFI